MRAQILSDAKHRREELVHAQMCTACGKGDFDKVRRLLLSRSVDIDQADFAGRRAIHLAARGGNKRIIELLIAQRADVNVEDGMGNTPLSDALHCADSSVAKLLVEHGARHGSRDVSDDVCSAASEQTGIEELRRLCQFGGNVNASNHERRTPLHIAAVSGRVANAQMLLDAGADVNAVDRRGVTPLHGAVLAREDEMCELLLRHGASLGEFDEALHLNTAAAANDTLHIARLVKFRCSVNAQDILGRAPLHLAASSKRVNALSLLLDTPGIDVNIEDSFGNTPYDDAIREPSAEQQVLVALFESRGAQRGSHTRRAGATTATKAQIEGERAQKMAEIIAARDATIRQVTALNRWVKEEREAARLLKVQVEKAVRLEAEKGAVLADEAPEVWDQVYAYAEGYFEWRDEALRRVKPMVDGWLVDCRDFALLTAQRLKSKVSAPRRARVRRARSARASRRFEPGARRLPVPPARTVQPLMRLPPRALARCPPRPAAERGALAFRVGRQAGRAAL